MLLSRALLVGLAAASFLCTAGVVRSQLAGDHHDDVADKLEFLAQNDGRYTALIVGASGLLRGVDPNVVDPIVQRVEPEFRSFNLAARGMREFETDYVLRQALKVAGSDVRWLLLEPGMWSPVVETVQLDVGRTQEWHDWKGTRAVLRASIQRWNSGQGDARRWLSYHVRKSLHRLSNYGLGSRLMRGVLSSWRRRYITAEQMERGHGFVTVRESEGAEADARKREFLEEVDEYWGHVERISRGKLPNVGEAALTSHRRQRQWLEERGIEVIYVVPPYHDYGLFAGRLSQLGEAPRLLNFVKPLDYPELYELDARADAVHLNAHGALLLSQLVGNQVAELIASDSNTTD